MEIYLPLGIGPRKEIDGVLYRSLFSYNSDVVGELLVPDIPDLTALVKKLNAITPSNRNEALVGVITEWVNDTLGVQLKGNEQILIGDLVEAVKPYLKKGDK